MVANLHQGWGASSQPNTGSSTNVLHGRALIEKNSEISKNLEENSLISKYNTQPSSLETAKQRFPLKNPKNVAKSVVLYTSWYNLKCKTLIELTLLKDASVESDSVLTSIRSMTSLT